MQVDVPPDFETLIKKRLSGGGYASVEDVLRRALEAQDAEESWSDEGRQALAAHVITACAARAGPPSLHSLLVKKGGRPKSPTPLLKLET